MEMAPECVPCLLRRVIFETELCDPGRAHKAVSDSIKILHESFEPGANSAEVATLVHRRVYHILGCADPYRELKLRSDEVAESLLPRARQFIEKSENRVEAAVICSIAGNVMDFGIGTGFDGPETLCREFDRLVGEGLAVNDLPEAMRLMGKGRKVVYLLDNCGEVVFDKLLVSELKSLGARVIGVVKGEPVLTDVTMEDAKRTGIDALFDEMLSTGGFAVGVDTKRMGNKLREEMSSADLIISKGMANFEALSDSDFRPILYLMRAKCQPVAEAVGARKDDNVARLVALKR